MSLNVALYDNKIADAIKLIKETQVKSIDEALLNGAIDLLKEIEPEQLYSRNINHNLIRMAMEAGIYEHLWRPDEINITRAHELIEPLTNGLALLESDPERFKAFDVPNDWGLYKYFVLFVRYYLTACIKWPDAVVEVSR